VKKLPANTGMGIAVSSAEERQSPFLAGFSSWPNKIITGSNVSPGSWPCENSGSRRLADLIAFDDLDGLIRTRGHGSLQQNANTISRPSGYAAQRPWSPGAGHTSDRSWSACNPTFIVTGGGVTTAALQRATATIPIVFATLGDPVASGQAREAAAQAFDAAAQVL
jgi:hypothetical protein